jgi:hypothetical protein
LDEEVLKQSRTDSLVEIVDNQTIFHDVGLVVVESSVFGFQVPLLPGLARLVVEVQLQVLQEYVYHEAGQNEETQRSLALTD